LSTAPSLITLTCPILFYGFPDGRKKTFAFFLSCPLFGVCLLFPKTLKSRPAISVDAAFCHESLQIHTHAPRRFAIFLFAFICKTSILASHPGFPPSFDPLEILCFLSLLFVFFGWSFVFRLQILLFLGLAFVLHPSFLTFSIFLFFSLLEGSVRSETFRTPFVSSGRKPVERRVFF